MEKPSVFATIWAGIKKIWKDFKCVIITFLTVLFVFNFVVLNGHIPSESMENTVMTGDSIIAFRLAYLFDAPKCGDIIIFNSEQTSNKEYIKRIIGTSGDVVDIKNDGVYRNGEKLSEPYAQGNTHIGDNKISHFVVPDDCVLVFGDNREHSRDSRFMENPYISCSDITGKLILRYSIFSNGFFFKPI